MTLIGFACSCDNHSVRVGVARCKRCNGTEVVTPDGTACVPRRCVKDAAGRLNCRKCPADYIVGNYKTRSSILNNEVIDIR